MAKTKKVYIAGPMRGVPYWNRNEFEAAEQRFRDYGAKHVVNPLKLDLEAGMNPHPEGKVDPTVVPGCLKRDLAELATCDVIAFLPGWEGSKGCQFEMLVAEAIGLEIWDAYTLKPLDRKPAHPGSQAFYDAVEEIRLLHAKKQRDYGTDADPFANVRASEEFGIPPWLGAVVRMNDKIGRLRTYAKKGTLANEGVEDSLLDSAVYSLIALVLFREQAAKV